MKLSQSLLPFAAVYTAVVLFLFPTSPAKANTAGSAGATGTGANVTMTTTTRSGVPYSVILNNGIVSAEIKIATAQLIYLNYNGTQFTDGYYASSNGCFYWQGTSGSSDTLVTVADPATNGGNYAEIDLEDPAANSGNGADAHRHFTLFRGASGVYVTEIITRSSSMAAGGVDIPSLTGKLNLTPLNWLASDGSGYDVRSNATPLSGDTSIGGVNSCPKEVSLITSGSLAGQFDCKYNYAGDLGSLGVTGRCGPSMGIWIVHPSNEYFCSGPMHREILTQDSNLNTTFDGVHFTFNDDRNFAAGETWSKVCGPFFIYLNKVATGTSNPQATLFADAQAQVQAERAAWPCSWFTDSNYVQASGRGTVTGQIVISDSGNPNASAAGLRVGVAIQPSTTVSPATADFQQFGKNYQFWTKTDSNGNFTIPNVVAGSNYTLFAFGPGATGQFQSQALTGATIPVAIAYPTTQFAVTVTGGQTTSLGTVTWTPTRVGPTVWEIGIPDRNTQEFRHGDDYWHGDYGTASAPAESWAPYLNYRLDFPNGLNYTVGTSHWANDWDYAEPCTFDPATGNWNSTTWTVTFNMPQAPVSGAQALLYLGIAADNTGPVIVSVNGTNLGSTSGVTATPTSISSTGFFSYYDNDAMIRMSSHGIFCDERITFPGSLLKSGTNTVTLNMRKGGYFANNCMYDYVRLELAGYIPPAPASVTAIAGNNQVVLRWPAAPGATSYRVLRSTTSGTGYSVLASGITGPVSGSTADTATYTDTTAANGTTYYYALQSANPAGTSVISSATSTTPSASAPASPSAPTGLAATAGDTQVGLSWTASANAAYYLVERSSTSGGPYTIINTSTTGNTFTDTGRSNGTTYYYVVAAANASGTSGVSAEASARALPSVPSSAPGGLTASNSAGQVVLSWTPTASTTNYFVKRATSSGGTYTTLSTIPATSSYTDSSAAANTTYYYTVAAANLAGNSADSSPASITTPPAAPTNVAATAGSSKVTLTWTASTGATSYVIGRSTTTGGPYTTIAAAATGTSYVDNTGVNGTTYYYVIAATGAGGTGLNSAEVSAAPIGVTTLTWKGNASSTWDTATSNWLNGSTATTYADTYAVNFDDTATTTTVTISGTMSPFSTLFNNSTTTYTLTAATLAGTGDLTKLGTGTLNITGTDTYSGGTIIGGGKIAITGGTTNAQNGLGTGTITLQGGNLAMNGFGNSSSSTYGILANAISVPDGATGLLQFPKRGGQSGAVTGNGTFTVQVNYVRDDISGDWSAFTGQLNIIHTSSGTTVDNFRLANNTGFGTAAINIGPYVSFYTTLNASNTFTIGELSSTDATGKVSGITLDNGTPGSYTATFSVGGRNTDATFAGVISNGASPSVTAISKEGTGTWTLSGANTYTGATIVDAGTLKITGSLTATSSVTVNDSSTLSLSGGAITSTVNILNGGILTGNGTITGNLSNAGTISCGTGSNLVVTGNLTNTGFMQFTAGSGIQCSGTFTNSGILDVTTGLQTLPANFVNNGTVYDSSMVKVQDIQQSGAVIQFTLFTISGHNYQLQRTSSLSSISWSNVGAAVAGNDTAQTLTDSSAAGTQYFYRIVVNP
ncbi:MAG: polysaccharide lyase family protein [Chthoniobacteraceae bacterium]